MMLSGGTRKINMESRSHGAGCLQAGKREGRARSSWRSLRWVEVRTIFSDPIASHSFPVSPSIFVALPSSCLTGRFTPIHPFLPSCAHRSDRCGSCCFRCREESVLTLFLAGAIIVRPAACGGNARVCATISEEGRHRFPRG